MIKTINKFIIEGVRGALAMLAYAALVLGDATLIMICFSPDENFAIEPRFSNGLPEVNPDKTTSIITEVLLPPYMILMKFLSNYPRLVLMVTILFLTSFIILQAIVYLNTLDGAPKWYTYVKIFANSVSFSAITFYYNVVVVRSIPVSNDVVANLMLFKIIVKRSIVEKKALFYDTFYGAIDKADKLREVDRTYLKDYGVNEFEGALTENFFSSNSTEAIFNAATKHADGLVSMALYAKHLLEERKLKAIADAHDSSPLVIIYNGVANNATAILAVLGVCVLTGIFCYCLVNNTKGVAEYFGLPFVPKKTIEEIAEAEEIAGRTIKGLARGLLRDSETFNAMVRALHIKIRGINDRSVMSPGFAQTLELIKQESAMAVEHLENMYPRLQSISTRMADMTVEALRAGVKHVVENPPVV